MGTKNLESKEQLKEVAKVLFFHANKKMNEKKVINAVRGLKNSKVAGVEVKMSKYGNALLMGYLCNLFKCKDCLIIARMLLFLPCTIG